MEVPTFSLMLSFIAELELPTIVLDRADISGYDTGDGDDGAFWTSRPLGSGVSSTVFQWTTDQRTKDQLSPGTVVAMKSYSIDFQRDSSKLDERVYDSLRRELSILRHPILKSHDNICRLHFIAWEESNLFPLLALELATYGSLEDLTKSSPFALSGKQLNNIAVDISLGLLTLHECSIAHGDLKPANILLQNHPERQIVAKLADFGGSAVVDLSSSAVASPRTVTPEWLAPEAIWMESMPEVDWYAADVYSLGLVLASFWAANVPSPTSGCFLESFIPHAYFLPDEQQQAFTRDYVLFLKTNLEESKSNAFLLALRAITDETFTKLKEKDAVQDILRLSLQPLPVKRKTITELVAGPVSALATMAGRRPNPEHGDQFSTLSMLQRYRRATFNSENIETTDLQSSHSLPIKRINFPIMSSARTAPNSYPRMIQEVENFYRSLPSGLPEFPEELDEIEDAELLLAALTDRSSRKAEEVRSNHQSQMIFNSHIALLISYNYLSGAGGAFDLEKGFEWLCKAARGGLPAAMEILGMAGRCIPSTELEALPLRYMLVLGSLGSSKECQVSLKAESPRLFNAVCRIAEAIKDLNTSQSDQDGMYYSSLLTRIATHLHTSSKTNDGTFKPNEEALTLNNSIFPSLTIVPAFESDDTKNALYLLVQAVADPARRKELLDNPSWSASDGRGYLHLLALLEDGVAAQLIPDLVNSGAPMSGTFSTDRFQQRDPVINIVMSRGDWAPLELYGEANMPESFKIQLHLHVSRGEGIHALFFIMKRLVQTTKVAMLGEILELLTKTSLPYRPYGSSETVWVNFDPSDLTIFLQEIICEELPECGFLPRAQLHRSAVNSKKRDTINLLLEHGADPFHITEKEPKCILVQCVLGHDIVALQTILEFLERSGRTPLHHLEDDKYFRGHDALGYCILSSAGSCVDLLMEKFPALMEKANAKGWRAIHCAASSGDLRIFRALLEKGADLMAATEAGATIILLALCYGHCDVADLIMDKCDPEQIDDLLLRPAKHRLSLFGQLAVSWLRMPAVTIDAFGWVSKQDEQTFFIDKEQEYPVWMPILDDPPRPLPEDALRDLQLLNYFFETFADKLNETDPLSGRTPLHLACLNVHLDAVKLLLEYEVAIDKGVAEGHELGGWTALDFIMLRQRPNHVHPSILNAGRRRLARWNADIKAIYDLLIANDANTGREDQWIKVKIQFAKSPVAENINVTEGDDLMLRGDEAPVAWPAPIPLDADDADASRRAEDVAKMKRALGMMPQGQNVPRTGLYMREQRDELVSRMESIREVLELRRERWPLILALAHQVADQQEDSDPNETDVLEEIIRRMNVV
ncbi:hypothetical protein LTR84_001315 [Exophiala bonariae]|uniref:Protein kinase domain-containing protein n=1 Tax=Exophiala bonariae TaxID=1690606 RepID=A0AAV9NCA9_9EURO|nr:hypothetical protein LTR84_001315 [Exophiala bonariae]